jgi:hypothetical protein
VADDTQRKAQAEARRAARFHAFFVTGGWGCAGREAKTGVSQESVQRALLRLRLPRLFRPFERLYHPEEMELGSSKLSAGAMERALGRVEVHATTLVRTWKGQ